MPELPDAVKVLLIAAGSFGAWPLYKNVIKPATRAIIRSLVRDYLNSEYVRHDDLRDIRADTAEMRESFDKYKRECDEAASAFNDQLRQRIADLATQMQNFVSRVVDIEVKVGVFWKMLEQSTANLLHRDDTPNIDRLLEKLPASNMTDDERRQLLTYLEGIERGDGDEVGRPQSRRTAAALLRAAIVSEYYADEYEY